MVMFAGAVRVHDAPSQELPAVGDPAQVRDRVAETLRARHECEHPPFQPWPAPEVPMRVVEPGLLKDAPVRLLRRLRSAGWAVVVTYARGTTFDAQRRPGAVVSSWALRSKKGNRRAVAVWWERAPGKYETRGVLVFGDRPAQWIGLREFEREI